MVQQAVIDCVRALDHKQRGQGTTHQITLQPFTMLYTMSSFTCYSLATGRLPQNGKDQAREPMPGGHSILWCGVGLDSWFAPTAAASVALVSLEIKRQVAATECF